MTLHIPQKDSPSTYLTAAIDEDDTTLMVADSSIFQNVDGENDITRLTLGFDTATTETVTVVSYGAGNTIVVERGTPSYSWGSGTTKIARVLTAQDITEIHSNITDHDHTSPDWTQIPTDGIEDHAITPVKLDSNITNHDHTGPDWTQIPTDGIEDYAITPAKLANRIRRITLSTMTSGIIAMAGEYVHGARVKYSPTEQLYANFHGFIPKDFVSNAVLVVMISNFIHLTPTTAIVTISGTRLSSDNIMGNLFDIKQNLIVPGAVIGEGYYRIQQLVIPLSAVMVDDLIIGGVHLGPDAGSNEVVFQGAYLEYNGR